MIPASRQFRQPDLSPVHLVFLCRHDSQARRTCRRWNLPGEEKAGSDPSANLGIAIFLEPMYSKLFAGNRGIGFSCIPAFTLARFMRQHFPSLELESLPRVQPGHAPLWCQCMASHSVAVQSSYEMLYFP